VISKRFIDRFKGSGDQKFIPDMSKEALKTLAELTPYSSILEHILAVPPYSLGFPSKNAQSMYYPGKEKLTQDEIAEVSRIMEQNGVYPENTRVAKNRDSTDTFHVLQASINIKPTRTFKYHDSQIILKPGDHADELSKICDELRKAQEHSANETQKQFIQKYIESFVTGDLEAYRDSQRIWVRDHGPRVENIFGFVEPYRDPLGIRAEFEGLVAISDPEETKVLSRLVEHSDKLIRKLPWAAGSTSNNGKGSFEKSLFEPPDFTSIHGKL
jgi:dipeptidyl-peptidase III